MDTMTQRTNALVALLLVLALLASAAAAAGSEADGKPEPSPQSISVNPGEAFELEVPVQAWADSNYTVTFMERTRFTFPGDRSQTYFMESSDAILFKVPCRVDDDAPDGNYKFAFEVAWQEDDETEKVFGELEVVVGEGAGDPLTCESILMVAAPSVLAFSLLMVHRRR
jgi:hypothetical protein